jgi:hypothetical protein
MAGLPQVADVQLRPCLLRSSVTCVSLRPAVSLTLKLARTSPTGFAKALSMARAMREAGARDEAEASSYAVESRRFRDKGEK